MLILIGTVPTAYALNRALPDSQVAQFSVNSDAAAHPRRPAPCRDGLRLAAYPSLAVLIQDIDKQVKQYGSLSKIPAEAVGNTQQ